MEHLDNFTLHVKNEEKVLQKIQITEPGIISIGSSSSSNITINAPGISRQHINLEFRNGQLLITDQGSSNGSFINQKRLDALQAYSITENTSIILASGVISLYIEIIKNEKQEKNQLIPDDMSREQADQSSESSQIATLLKQQGQVIIGRSVKCDLVLPSLQVSRQHAVLRQKDSQVTIEDFSTTNGTYINGNRIVGVVVVLPSDKITVGPSTFYIDGGIVDLQYSIVAENIEKKYPNGFVGLNKMSIKIASKEFVALMGPSGCGKSTLLKGLNGANPITSGSITIQGVKLNNNNFNTLKKHIGYVPQDDIVHGELSVEKTLFYAAKLRMAKDVTNDEISQKIDQVLTSLNLDASSIRHNRIDELSGGQRKRISIAVELLNDPTILFLDEPTSPLDPETIEDFLGCIRNLVEEGQTVIMVTHKPSDLDYVDKVIFLSKGGYQTYFGDKNTILSHFNRNTLIEVYSLMKNATTGKEWYEKWVKDHPDPKIEKQNENLQPKPATSMIRQYYWLSLRYLNIKRNDFWNLALLLAQPFIIGFLLVFIFASLQLSVLFMMAISAVWFGVSNASKEIVSELAIYERERMFNLNIANYIASKVTVLSLIAFIQVIIFVGIVYLTYGGETNEIKLWLFWPNVGFMFFLAVSATIFGLLLSAVFTNTEKVMTFVPIALMPQIMLAGIIAQLDSNIKTVLSYFTLGRWGTEGFAHIQDFSAEKLGEWATEDQSIPASVMQLLPKTPEQPQSPPSPSGSGSSTTPAEPPAPPPIEMELQPQGAMEQLNFYDLDKNLISLFPESFGGVVSAIMALNVLCLLGIYVALKTKDKRFV